MPNFFSEDMTSSKFDFDQSQNRRPGQFPKVLVVDDEPRILRSLQAALKSKFEVLTAAGAEQAKQVFAESDKIDIIVSDERMPRCTGLELLHWCRDNQPDCVRILLSSTDFSKKRDAILSADIYRCIAKPWNIQEFIEVLDRAAQIGVTQDRRGSDTRRGSRRERRSRLVHHCALAVLDPDLSYRDAYKQVVGNIADLAEIYVFESAEAVCNTMLHTSCIGIVVIDLAIGEQAAVNLIQDIRNRNSNVMIVVTSDPSSISEFMPRVAVGDVHKFIAKPLSSKRIQPVVADALKRYFIKIRKNNR